MSPSNQKLDSAFRCCISFTVLEAAFIKLISQ